MAWHVPRTEEFLIKRSVSLWNFQTGADTWSNQNVDVDFMQSDFQHLTNGSGAYSLVPCFLVWP